MKWVYAFTCLTFFYAEVIPDIQLEQPDPTLTVHVGSTITLRCTLKEGDLKDHQMNWYKKNWDNSLTFIYQHEGKYGPGLQENFSGNMDSDNLFTLKINKAAVKDAGTYYCGSFIGGSSWHTRAMYFGTGTELSVEPEMQETSLPSKIFVMKNGTNAACLVKDFYPKSIAINLYPENNTRKVVTIVNGKFSAVKFGQYTQDLENITCTAQYKNQTIMTSYNKSNVNSTDKSTDTEEPTDLSSIQDCLKPSVKIENINLLSITLLGLRVLLAKSVAVNFFLTIKCFLI